MSILGDIFGFGKQTTTSTATPQVPADVEAARKDLLGRAQAFAAEPYSPYVMRRPGTGGGPVNMGPGSGGAPPARPVNMGPESGGGMIRYLPPEKKPGGGDTFKADLGFPDSPFGISVGVPGTPTYRFNPMEQFGEEARLTGFPTEEYVSIPRVAGFTPDQIAAFETTRNIAGAAGALAPLTPELTREGIAATRSLAQRLPDVNIQEYMSPYTQGVLDPAIRDIEEKAARERLRLGQQAGLRGSFGGSRQAIQESELERGTQREIGDLSARQRAAAYNQALAQFRADQERIPQLYSGALAQLGTGLTQTAGRLGVEAQPLLNIGGMQQALDQQNLDVLRRAFEEERDYPIRGIEVLRGALGITPSSLGIGSVQQQSAPGPNVLGSVIGGLTQVPAAFKGASTLYNFFTNPFGT
jgi:hypothetical protein